MGMKKDSILKALFIGVPVAGLLALPFLGIGETVIYYLLMVMIYAIFAMGFDLVFGVSGLLSLGHSTFFGAGAYTLAILTARLGLPFWASFIAAGILAALVAMAFGFISMRLSAIFLSLATLALAELIHIVMTFKWRSFSGGPDGLSGVPRPSFWGIDFSQSNNYYLFVVFFFLLAIVVSALIRSSPFGQVLQGMRQNPIRAQQIGFDLKKFKLGVFVISGFFCGIAGGLMASLTFFTDPSNLSFDMSVSVVIMTLLGGAGTLLGPIFGVMLYELLRQVLSTYTSYWMGVIGGLFIIYTIFLPGGVMGLAEKSWRYLRFGFKGIKNDIGNPEL
jgi:branched-chain amino acid transport system permease protein